MANELAFVDVFAPTNTYSDPEHAARLAELRSSVGVGLLVTLNVALLDEITLLVIVLNATGWQRSWNIV